MHDKIEAEMTAEMHHYRHMFHPFKLSIMNLLYTNPKITSIEIRSRLGLSMSEYYSSVKSLEKHKLLVMFDDFDDEGATRQYVTLEEKGKTEYADFIKLVGKYVNLAKDYIPDYDGTSLYP